MDIKNRGDSTGIGAQQEDQLAPCKTYSTVADVRVLGAIGVVEMKDFIDVAALQKRFVDAGVWIRPFAKLVYVMPAFNIEATDLSSLTAAVVEVLKPSR